MAPAVCEAPKKSWHYGQIIFDPFVVTVTWEPFFIENKKSYPPERRFRDRFRDRSPPNKFFRQIVKPKTCMYQSKLLKPTTFATPLCTGRGRRTVAPKSLKFQDLQ
jgi:hypothetical protein